MQYKTELELTAWWEMDTVIGRIGGKYVLTFNFVPGNFMFGLLINDKSALEVSEKIKYFFTLKFRQTKKSER